MNRCEWEEEFEDALGSVIHWSLRAEFGDAEPPAGSWRRLETRIAALERARAERSSRRALLRRLLGQAIHLIEASALALDAPGPLNSHDGYILAHERPISPWASPWPAYGQMMPIW